MLFKTSIKKHVINSQFLTGKHTTFSTLAPEWTSGWWRVGVGAYNYISCGSIICDKFEFEHFPCSVTLSTYLWYILKWTIFIHSVGGLKPEESSFLCLCCLNRYRNDCVFYFGALNTQHQQPPAVIRLSCFAPAIEIAWFHLSGGVNVVYTFLAVVQTTKQVTNKMFVSVSQYQSRSPFF